MTENDKNNRLFVSALKEAVRQFPHYFYLTESINDIESIWDMQPQYGALESLLLEDETTQQFIIAVWSFFKPINLGSGSFAEMTRLLQPWQKTILTQMIIHDPLGMEMPETTTESN